MRFLRALWTVRFGLAAVALALAGCKVQVDGNANGTGFGGTDDDYVVLDLRREEAVEALRHYRDGDRRHLWGDLNYSGDSPTVNALLRATVEDPSKRAHVVEWLANEAQLNALIDALEAVEFTVTNDPSLLEKDGEIQTALTVGNRVYFRRSVARRFLREDAIATWIHEGMHLIGYLDSGRSGPFSPTQLFLSCLGAGGAAYHNGINGRRNSESGSSSSTSFYEPFSSDEWTDRWTVHSGNGTIVPGGLRIDDGDTFYAETSAFTARNFVASAFIDLSDATTLPWAHVGGRRSANGSGYSVGVGRNAGGILVSLFRRDSDWVTLCSRQFAAPTAASQKGRAVLEVNGDRLSATFRGEFACSVADTTYGDAGRIFLRTSSRTVISDLLVRP